MPLLRLMSLFLLFMMGSSLTLSQDDETLHPPVIGFTLTDEYRSCCPHHIKVLNPYNGSFIIIKEEFIIQPDTLEFSPNAHFISYISSGALHIYDLRQQRKVNYTKFPLDFSFHRWSPDGQTIAILGWHRTMDRRGRSTYNDYPKLYLLDLKSWELTEVTKDLSVLSGFSWSPDSSKLLFSAVNASEGFYRLGNEDIYILDVQSLDYTNVTQSADYNHSPSWSLDGTQFAHTTGKTKPDQLVIRDANAPYEVLQTIELNIGWINAPRWVLDDEYILYGASSLYMVDIETEENILLARSSYQGATSSPDGGKVIYLTSIKEDSKLCVIDLYSLGEQCIEGETIFFDQPPVWGGWR